MKREKSYVDKRRASILEQIIEKPGIRVEELAEKYMVSPITIRRDLQYLEDQKKLVRFYGGAMVPPEIVKEEDEIAMYRTLIAQYVASLVEDEDSIFINTSSNALQAVSFIKNKKHVTVITNNGKAIYTEHAQDVNIVLTGGELLYPKETMVGEFAERNLRNVYAKKAFIGCRGISAAAGMTTEIANEVNLNRLMITRIASEAYVLADHTKIGKRSSFRTCGLNKIAHVITDEKAPPEELEKMCKMGVHVHIVHKGDTF